MKCHFVNDKIAGKVLITGCWSVVNSQDISDCSCPKNPHLEYMALLKKEGRLDELKEYRSIFNEFKNDRPPINEN